MAERKLSDEPDRMFVHETSWSEVTETICVKIKDFTEKIEDLENKKKPIKSPRFVLAGKSLSVGVYVYPEDFHENSEKFISVYLNNYSKENITATLNFKSSIGAGENRTIKKRISAGHMRGHRHFLSHSDYKKWALENEDIFSLEVKVTLHVKNPGTWTTER